MSGDSGTVASVAAAVNADARSTRGSLGARVRARVALSDALGLAASCLVVVIAFSPVIFGGRMLSAAGVPVAGTNGVSAFPGEHPADHEADIRNDQGASTWAFEPWVEVNDRTYASGELPLWNPFQGAGSPQAANMQSAPFDPLLLPVNLHPSPRTWDLAIIAAFMLGAAFAFAFARVLGLVAIAAFTASAAFSISGYFLLYSNNHFARSYVYLPIVFLLVELVVRSRKVLPVFGLGVATACNVYLGMPEASAFVLGAAAVYAVIRIAQQRDTISARAGFARIAGGFALGGTLAAPLLLLFQEFEALSFSVHSPSDAVGQASNPLRLGLNWVFPFFSGERVPAAYNGVDSWTGAAVLLLALLALSQRRRDRDPSTWAFFGIAAILFMKSYGFPVVELAGRLPVLERLNFVRYGAPVVGFALAMLAGIGVHVLRTRTLDLRRFGVALAGGAALFLTLVLVDGNWSRLTGSAPRSRLGTVGPGALAVLLILLVVAAVRRRPRHWAAGIVSAVVVLELMTLVPWNIYRHEADQYASPGWRPIADQILRDEPDARVFGIDGKLFPNTAGALGFQDIRILDALYVDRYRRYVQTFLQPSMTDRFIGSPAGSSEREVARYRNNPMFDALSVRVILSQAPLEPLPSLRERGADRDTVVYEDLGAYPRAWLVHRVHSVPDEDAAYRFLEDHGHRERGALVMDTFDPRTEAVVERARDASDRVLRTLRPGRSSCPATRDDQVSVREYTANSVTLDVEAECRGLVVLPDTYYPGWEATVDGTAATIHPVNGAFRGVPVPAGHSTIEFRYDPPRFRLGILAALAGLLGFGVAAGWVNWRRRTASAGAGDPTADETAGASP